MFYFNELLLSVRRIITPPQTNNNFFDSVSHSNSNLTFGINFKLV